MLLLALYPPQIRNFGLEALEFRTTFSARSLLSGRSRIGRSGPLHGGNSGRGSRCITDGAIWPHPGGRGGAGTLPLPYPGRASRQPFDHPLPCSNGVSSPHGRKLWRKCAPFDACAGLADPDNQGIGEPERQDPIPITTCPDRISAPQRRKSAPL